MRRCNVITPIVLSLLVPAALIAQRPCVPGRCDDGIHAGKGSGSGNESSASTAAASRGIGTGLPVLGGPRLLVRNGVARFADSSEVGPFGLAVDCRASCSAKRTDEGRYLYHYDANPMLSSVRRNSPASRAGVAVGDEITQVNGKSVLADDALVGTDAASDVTLEVRRNGTSVKIRVTRDKP